MGYLSFDLGKPMNAYSADQVKLEPGMRVWVNSGVVGNPPKEAVVGEIISEHKFHYPEPDEDGYIGSRARGCWVSRELAFAYAIVAGYVKV